MSLPTVACALRTGYREGHHGLEEEELGLLVMERSGGKRGNVLGEKGQINVFGESFPHQPRGLPPVQKALLLELRELAGTDGHRVYSVQREHCRI